MDPARPPQAAKGTRMNDVEDRVTSLLTRTAEAVDVEPDIDRVLGAPPESNVIPLSSGKSRRRRTAVVAVGAAAAVFVAIVAYSVSTPGRDDVEVDAPAASSGPEASPGGEDASSAPEDASSPPPRYLVTQDGWKIDFVDEPSLSFSETTFSDGAGNSLQLARYRADEYPSRVEPPIDAAESSRMTTIAGQEAVIYDVGYFSAWWMNGGYNFELRGDTFANREDFEAVAATVNQVDEAKWLAALPEDTVHPDELIAEVDAALVEVPLPAGLDPQGVLAAMDRRVGARDQLRTAAVNVVVCAWIQQWSDAKEAGDTGALDEAVSAMSSSREWPLLAEKAGGPWAQYIWDVADAMAADQPVEGWDDLSQAAGYLRHVGCPES